MKITLIKVLFAALVLAFSSAAAAQIASFKHVVIIFQENRTPDNLFQGLCVTGSSCSTHPTGNQYNIQTSNWFDNDSSSGRIQPLPVPLASTYDLHHSRSAWALQCNPDTSGACKMDGSSDVPCDPVSVCNRFPHPQFRFVDNSNGILNSYLMLARQYGWANYMFQTNQGPSFPAHQFIFGGTSAPLVNDSVNDDALGIFASENPGETSGPAGCIALAGTTVQLVDSSGERRDNAIFPCFEHQTMADLFDKATPPISWKYYAPGASSIWTAPNAIQHICQPDRSTGGTCTGPSWVNNVDLNPKDVLTDIGNCNLPGVSWVIPTGNNSDHAGISTGGGPSWVASIVNTIGQNTACDGSGYWNDTAILVAWDDWGGWYDHEPPTILAPPAGNYQLGFRVPLIVVSAYTPAGYINNSRLDFGSMLRFVEQNFSLGEGALGFADARATTDLAPFFNLKQGPRKFQVIPALHSAKYFLNDRTPPTDPDDD